MGEPQAGAVNRERPYVQQAQGAELQGADLFLGKQLGHVGRCGLCERRCVLE